VFNLLGLEINFILTEIVESSEKKEVCYHSDQYSHVAAILLVKQKKTVSKSKFEEIDE
jgi:hypothetical protein